MNDFFNFDDIVLRNRELISYEIYKNKIIKNKGKYKSCIILNGYNEESLEKCVGKYYSKITDQLNKIINEVDA